ncbi:MAG: DDE-type integrase/transposase/recombinase [Anaerolineae bacterium]|nr:DDE-type integrase/transposase/recombinase [Anaerolineae bacterium]
MLDDFSRYIIAWKLTTGISHTDVEDTLDLAIAATGVKQVAVKHRPRLLSDNGSAYISGDLADYLEHHGIRHTRGAPYHPQTQGKIERYHRSTKNVICRNIITSPGCVPRGTQPTADLSAWLNARRARLGRPTLPDNCSR